MKPVLILQHQLPENAAYLITWLKKHNISYQVVNAGRGETFPESIEPYSAMAVMGGSMSSNDPLLNNRQAEILILQAILKNRPVIGHCLGGQLMTRALGGTVTKSPKPEIGWQPITYTNNDRVKEWFGNEPTDTVIHWHYEAFTVPDGATLLASSDACPNQAWTYGPHLAMQFHIEIDSDKVYSWVNDSDKQWEEAQVSYDTVQNRETMIAKIDKHLSVHQTTADNIYKNWLKTTEWRIKESL